MKKNVDDLILEGVALMKEGKTAIGSARIISNNHTSGLTLAYLRQAIAKAFKSTTADKFTAPVTEKEDKVKPFVLSAWNFDTGKMMDIEEYCTFYNLPIENVTSYKLVTHTGTPFYNTQFRDVKNGNGIISSEHIESAILKHVKSVVCDLPPVEKDGGDWFDRVVYTDTHIGMDTDKEGIAMYATPWNRQEQLRRASIMVYEILKNKTSSVLYLDELGDFMDGWDGLTTRGGHVLPQNMTNEDAFDTGLDFKMAVADGLVPHYAEVHFHNVTNDNHAGPFGYVVNSSFKRICDLKYGNRVVIDNQRPFISHYVVGKHAFITTHGKDKKSLKFGFKPKLDPPQSEKIDAYIKKHNLYALSEFREFSKGDSHQMLLDYATSDDFAYFNYPAFSPASEWVQNNFKKGRSGFVIQNVMYNEDVKNIIPKFF